MNALHAALWGETLKARRSWVARGISIAFLALPLMDALFMIILKDPERARALGLISLKAQLQGGQADWPTLFGIYLQGAAIGGAMIFAFMAAWVYGREFSDHTAKELLAIPAPRAAIVAAKLIVIAVWMLALVVLGFAIAVGLGFAVQVPGWTPALAWASAGAALLVTLLLCMLMPLIALLACMGHGYLLPLGFAVATMALAQIVAILGWGDWFPWALPALASGAAGPEAARLGWHSYLVMLVVFVGGLAGAFLWWQRADQAR